MVKSLIKRRSNQSIIKLIVIVEVEVSGVSRKSEWEGTKCQKFTRNEIHWEQIPPLWIPLSKFLHYILQGVAKKILGSEVEIKGVRTYISSGHHRSPKVRGKNKYFFSNLWLKIIEFKMKVFTSGVIAPQARKKRILHSAFCIFFIISGAVATLAPPSYVNEKLAKILLWL